MLWSTPAEHKYAAGRSHVELRTGLSAEERELSSIAERVASD